MITVTKPVAAPTGLNAVVQAGGNLAPSTTYYYIVIAYNNYYTTAAWNRRPCFSDISAEDSFTTDAVNKSVKITWANSAGATHYNILISTISGDYTASGGYTITGGAETIGSITDGPTGITITDLSPVNSSTIVFHSCQLTNPMHPQIDNDLGLIWCEFSGTGTETLTTLYNAIIAAGFSDYVYYDGFTFVLKGWIYTESSDAGLFYAENKMIIMLKGGIHNLAQAGGYVFRFGRYFNDYVKGNPYYGCWLDFQGARYTFLSYYTNHDGLLVYDSMVSFSRSRVGSEPLYNGYFNGAAGSYVTSNIRNFLGCIIQGNVRANTTDVSDLKYGQGNNWGNVNHVRLNIYNTVYMPYSYGLGAFYNCDFNTFAQYFMFWIFEAGYDYYVYMYDCRYNGYPGGIVDKPYVRYMVSSHLTNGSYMMNCYRVQIKVQDSDGNPIQGVNVNCKDKDGNDVTWIEHDGSMDRIATGVTYSTDRTTDENGMVDYYIKSYKNYLNPENTENIGGYSYDTMRDIYYPFEITISKNGLAQEHFFIDELLEPFIAVVEMIPPKEYVESLILGEIHEDVIQGVIAEDELQGALAEAGIQGALTEDALAGKISEDPIVGELTC